MKKITVFLVLLLASFALIGCNGSEETYEFEIEAEETTLKVGGTTYVFVDTDKPNPEITFTSSDDELATVTDSGLVKALAVGEVEINVEVKGIAGKKKVTITIEEEAMLAAELRTLLTGVYNDYVNAKHGWIKVTIHEDLKDDPYVAETKYNYTGDAIDSLWYKASSSDDEIEVYVLDGTSYVDTNDEVLEKELTEQEAETIKTKYGHAEFLKPVTAFYNELDTYNALEYQGKDGNVVTFALNLGRYEGEVFNTAGVGEVLIKTTVENNKVTKVVVEVTEVTQVKSITVEYKGYGSKVTITNPYT